MRTSGWADASGMMHTCTEDKMGRVKMSPILKKEEKQNSRGVIDLHHHSV